MKAIILAGGAGSRLFPITKACSKQLLPVYDKPMVYYPIATLMLAGIREFLIITTPEQEAAYRRLLGTGIALGIYISYKTQARPRGLADAFVLGEDWLRGDSVIMMLGDNILFGHGVTEDVKNAVTRCTATDNFRGATAFAYRVQNAGRYGVVRFDEETGKPLPLIEKPAVFDFWEWAAIGLYIFSNDVVIRAGCLQPSARGEIEIVDLLNQYQSRDRLEVVKLGRGCLWFDAGNPDDLLDAAQFVRAVQDRQGMKIACLEEIAAGQGLISLDAAVYAGSKMPTPYGRYLTDRFQEKKP